MEKSIHLSVKSMVEKIDKAKISKTEFIIQQRIRHVLQNCEQLELIIEKLPATDPCKIDLLNRIDQLRYVCVCLCYKLISLMMKYSNL